MPDQPVPSATYNPPDNGQRLWWLGFGLVCILWIGAISDNSLWIDEGVAAAWKAKQPTLSDWWQDQVRDRNADTQTPLYLLYIWAFAKIFGRDEWVLRAANLPWMLAGMWAWLRALRPRTSLAFSLALVAATSPFLWYYANEARGYGMQAGAIFLMTAGALQLNRADSRGWLAVFCAGMVALAGSNLLGAIWAAAALATTVFALGWTRVRRLVTANLVVFLLTSLLLVALALYYLWTILHGDRATAVGSTDAKNLVFIFYELFGFGGAGPGRLEIRGNGLESFRPFFTWLALYALVLAPVALAGCRQIFKIVPGRIIGLTLFFFGGVFVFLAAVGVLTHFRVLGRHCTPAVILVIFILAFGVFRLWHSSRLWARAWVVLFVTVCLASSLSFRLATRHKKDDYRTAAAIARQAIASGKTVWWNADLRTGDYYQVPVTRQAPVPGMAWVLFNPVADILPASEVPELVVASKPDVYDVYGAVAEYLARNHFQPITNLPAFVIWQRGAY